MNEALVRHRQTFFTVLLLDEAGKVKKRLRRVRGGKVSFSAGSRLHSSGSLTIEGPVEGIDWLKDLVKIEINVNGQSWPLGAFVFASPKQSYSDGRASWSVELLSTLSLLDQQVLESPLSVPAGTLVTQYLGSLLGGVWRLPLSIEPSERRLSQPIVWEAGKSYLSVANDLLGAIGYWALYVDEGGTLRAVPYVRPAARPVVWTFAEGALSIHSPAWDREQDIAAIPNKVICLGQGSADAPGLVGVATLSDPASPYSFARRGRWVTKVVKGVEAASQEALNEIARRKLIEASTPQATMDVEFLPMPLSVNSVVGWKSQGADTRAVVSKWSLRLHPTALCRATLKEVVDA